MNLHDLVVALNRLACLDDKYIHYEICILPTKHICHIDTIEIGDKEKIIYLTEEKGANQ